MLRQVVIAAELNRFCLRHPPPVQDVSWHVRKLLICIHSDLFSAALNVQTLKTRCGIRDHNVSCRFKHEIGVSIRDYIESLRLKAAGQLLRQGTFSTSEVAQSIGYDNLQTFYRAFTRRFQCTPGAFRRQSCIPDVSITEGQEQ